MTRDRVKHRLEALYDLLLEIREQTIAKPRSKQAGVLPIHRWAQLSVASDLIAGLLEYLED